MPYSKFTPKEMILRDWLAKDRTVLANERTLLAYIRTALMLSVSGGTLIKFFAMNIPALIIGYCLVVIGILVGLWGLVRFAVMKRTLDQICEESSDG